MTASELQPAPPPTNRTNRPALGCTVQLAVGAGPEAVAGAERAVNSVLDRRIAATEARVLHETRGLRWEEPEYPDAGARWCVAWVELDVDGEGVIPDG